MSTTDDAKLLSIKKGLKDKYQNLSKEEKNRLGQALVKVNMGVGMPADLREVALFLKGSGYIAKEEQLNDLIEFFNADGEKSAKKKSSSLDTTTTQYESESLNTDSLIKRFREYAEDKEITNSEEEKEKKK